MDMKVSNQEMAESLFNCGVHNHLTIGIGQALRKMVQTMKAEKARSKLQINAIDILFQDHI